METGKSQVLEAVERAGSALREGDVIGLTAAYAALPGWDDQNRAHQARCQITERVLAHSADDARVWVPVFTESLRMLLHSLERDPCQPVVLNYAGVLLYELLQPDAAAALFGAALRLDPQLAHARQNLEAARSRKGTQARLPGAFGSRLKTLAGRGRRAAKLAQPPRGMTLSLCMIVRDEEEMLPGCLAPLRDVVDEIVVVDTGSTDATVEIAESFGARVVHFPWNGSFADARNVSIDAATGDWIMYLDADEHTEPADAPQLRELLHRTWREGFYLVETNYTGGEGSGAAMTHMALRLWRNRPEYRFSGRVHEQKTHNMPTYLPERWEHTGIRVRHYGYLNQRIRAREKSQRNIALLEQEAREQPSPFNDFNLARSLEI